MSRNDKNKFDNILSFLDIAETSLMYNMIGGRHGTSNKFRYCLPILLMDMILTYSIIIIGIIIYLITYKAKIIDPIESIKKTYISISCITICVLLMITLLVTIFSKNKKSLLKRSVVLFSIALVTTMIIIGIRINMDNKYSKAKFEQIYDEQNIDDSGEKTRIKISITEIGFISERDYFIEECVKIYKMFQTKTYGIFALYIMLDILLIYQVVKVLKIKENLDKIAKDDIVLFDEEENIKF